AEVGFYKLVRTAVYPVKWFRQAFQKEILFTLIIFMNWHHPERIGFALTDITKLPVHTGQLERVADQKNEFALCIVFIVVPNFVQKICIRLFPGMSLPVRIARPTGGDKDVEILNPRHLIVIADIKSLNFYIFI